MIPVYLDELNTHASKIAKGHVTPFLSSLFEVFDEIDLPSDAERGFGSMENTNLRYHWLLRRVTRERFTPEERSDALATAAQRASLGWLVDFTCSAVSEHSEASENGVHPEGECLVQTSAIEQQKKHTLKAIRAASEDGTLIAHRNLVSILFRWSALSGDASEVRAWTSERILEDEGLVALARDFTGGILVLGHGRFLKLGRSRLPGASGCSHQ